MIYKHPDINDDEIRIISSIRDKDMSPNTESIEAKEAEPDKKPGPNRKRVLVILCAAILAVVVLAIVLYVFFSGGEDDASELDLSTTPAVVAAADDIETTEESGIEASAAGYVAITDTVINSVPLSIFTPVGLTPSLSLGTDVLNDSTAKLVVQAADVRGDNGGIVGAYVNRGELLSKGQAKAGFCAIIGGKISVGVAEATPLLEQALETDGFFFRQYPLVVANQVVENKPKGTSLRKALAEWNGQPVVIMSNRKMTFHDFSQSLADLGVSNAIYLVGGKAYGFSVGANGDKTEFGTMQGQMHPNTNYIVWR